MGRGARGGTLRIPPSHRELPPVTKNYSSKERRGILQLANDRIAKGSPDGAVKDAVVERPRKVDHVCSLDLAVIVEDGTLDDFAHAEDRHLRVMDNGRGEEAAEVADRRDGEGAAAQILEGVICRSGHRC